MAEKEPRILFICESPSKAKHIKEFVPKNYIVMASQGHITRLADKGDYNIGIDFKNDFKPMYEIADGKQDIVYKLKDQVKAADQVILATDADREGEAISYHLKEELKIPTSKYKRITYHEVTKPAVLEALEHPRKIDMDLVEAALGREAADKIIGYRLSNIARAGVGARSVGRCQSAGLKLITDREKEIRDFQSKKYFDLYLYFEKNKTEFKAKYVGTGKKKIDSFDTLDAVKEIVAQCKGNDYIILDIQHKDSIENPKPPFITTTLQQESSRRLGISVKDTMDIAQKLFEDGLITYHRSDDPVLSPEFVVSLKEYIKNIFGESFVGEVKKGKKDENAQAGHEGIRVTDLNLTPNTIGNRLKDNYAIKLYNIIWQRTVASAMKPAIIANTIYTISNKENLFSMTSKELKFEGYRSVYNYGVDDDKSEDDQIVKEHFEKSEVLQNTRLEAVEKETTPPARFSEASFVAELTKRGIGRPSTYATILSTIIDPNRNYCTIDNKKIVPTELGMKLSDFLEKSFSDVINIEYTAQLESELDLIAKGEKERVDFLRDFYSKLENSIKKVDGGENRVCPECGKPLVKRFSPKTKRYFYGCSGYPACHHLENL